MDKKVIQAGPMLNVYPDSIGETLKGAGELLEMPIFNGVFESLYILPSIFNTDLDRGFSVIDYNINEEYATREDLMVIHNNDIDFKFDLIMNHASVLSKEFQDILKKGEKSPYADFFINWNEFWQDHGQMTQEGYIQPQKELIQDMYFRKPGLPILNVRMPDGKEVPYWNTFYQEVKYNPLDVQDLIEAMDIQYTTAEKIVDLVNCALDEGKKPIDIEFGDYSRYKKSVVELLEGRRRYLGQMDLNIRSPLVWKFYEETLKQLASYGARIVRLDAFAYASKEPGLRNFFNEPETWDILERLNDIAKKYDLILLPEIHSKYEEKIHEKISEKGYLTYDFFLPGLLIDAFERQTNEALIQWLDDLITKDIRTVNMLGCHDGIPLLDLKGLLTDEQIEALIDTVVARGGFVKDLHGEKNIYYQVNATYFSALGEDEKKLLLARAIQMFMPGKPQVWYLDLFAGVNDYDALEKAGSGGHKEINRTNLSMDDVKEALKKDVVKKQLDLIRFRNEYPAFGFDAKITVMQSESHVLKISWERAGHKAILEANLKSYEYEIFEVMVPGT